jgi:hypothetical protein
MAIKAGTNGVKTNTLQALLKMLSWFNTNKEALDDLIEGAPYEPKATQATRSTKKKVGD